jgi:hypothetical protein
LSALAVGAAFNNKAGRLIRNTSACGLFIAVLFDAAGFVPLATEAPEWASLSYPLLMASVLGSCGILLRHRLSIVLGALAACCWLTSWASTSYSAARSLVAGMDHLALSMAVFILALLISLAKSGRLAPLIAAYRRRRLALPGTSVPQAPDGAGDGG